MTETFPGLTTWRDFGREWRPWIKMACQVMSETVDLEAIFVFLSLHEYPPHITKEKKANFRRQASNFTLRKGELYKLHWDRKEDTSKQT